MDDQRSSVPAQLTSIRQDCLFPFWHPSGERIYFIADTALWVVAAAGGQPERLVEHAVGATISPDGQTLVLARVEDGTALWTATPDGKALSRRSNYTTAEPAVAVTLRFSRNGQMLGLKSGLTTTVLYLANYPLSSGKFPDQMIPFQVPIGSASLRSFDWMPDNRHVVLSVTSGVLSSTLWIGDILTKAVEPLSSSESLNFAPSVSADGLRVAFTSTALNWDIEQIDLRTFAVTPLVASARYDCWPAWTPSDKQLAFSTTRTGRPEIWLKSLRGNREGPIIGPEDFPAESTQILAQPAVSPNGRSIAYQRFDASGATQIYISPVSGGKPIQLAPSDFRQDYPAWSPDGNWIAFTTLIHSQTMPQRVVQKARPGGAAAPVHIAYGPEASPSIGLKWSRSGDILYVSSKGLAVTNEAGSGSRTILEPEPLVFDWSPDGSLVYAIRKTPQRHMEFFTLDPKTSQIRVLADLGPKPVSPDPYGNPYTIRTLAISPDGTRAAFSYLQPDSKIWMLEAIKTP